MRRALLVMAKRPSPGQTKTRLTPPLSAEQAAQLYEAFLQDIVTLATSLPDISPFIAYTPADAAPYFEALAPSCHLIAQKGASLGQRLGHVLSAMFERGFEQVAAINSDSPTLPPRFVAQAFALLDQPQVDAVFGPCDDGGYYLIGLKAPHPRLVLDVQMSTPHVLDDTLVVANREGLTTQLLPLWYDIDDIGDLRRLQAELVSAPPQVAQHTRRYLEEIGRGDAFLTAS